MKNYLTSRIKQSGSITVCVICPYCGFAQREPLKGLDRVICQRCRSQSEKGRYYNKKQLLEKIHELRRSIDLRHMAAIDSLSSGIYPSQRGETLRQQRAQLRCLINAAEVYGMTTQQQKEAKNND